MQRINTQKQWLYCTSDIPNRGYEYMPPIFTPLNVYQYLVDIYGNWQTNWIAPHQLRDGYAPALYNQSMDLTYHL